MNKSVLYEVSELSSLSCDELKARWRALHSTEPPSHNRSHLIKRLAYKIQENSFGGLTKSSADAMDRVLDVHGYDSSGARQEQSHKKSMPKKNVPITGTRMVREWNGRVHEVVAADGGFEYQGRRYRSLTAVAKEITGTHWNGRAFFGVANTHTKKQRRGSRS